MQGALETTYGRLPEMARLHCAAQLRRCGALPMSTSVQSKYDGDSDPGDLTFSLIEEGKVQYACGPDIEHPTSSPEQNL